MVGIFPKTFQTLGIQDLGSGGFDGFSCLNDSAQFKCIDGGHGAAIKENIWDELAHITVYGQLSGSKILARKERSNKIKFLAFISPFIFLAGLLLIIGGAASILILVNDPTWKLFFLSCYIFLIYKILTWV